MQSIEGPDAVAPRADRCILGGERMCGAVLGEGEKRKRLLPVAGAPALAPVAVDGCLQLTWGAQAFPLALVRIQVLHVPGGGGGGLQEVNNTRTDLTLHHGLGEYSILIGWRGVD